MIDFDYRKPTTGRDILAAAPPGTQIHLYSDLAKDPRPAHKIIESLGRNNIILLQNPSKMNSGHWIGLSIHPEERKMYFFSSYGGRPDEEKNMWLTPYSRWSSGQYRNVLNDGMKYFAQRGWEIHYNDKHFQIEGDDTATCGIWTVAFLRSGQDPDKFATRRKRAEDYYRQYFKSD